MKHKAVLFQVLLQTLLRLTNADYTTTCVSGMVYKFPKSKTSPLLPLLVVPKRLPERRFFTAASRVQPQPATTNEPFLIRAHCVTSLSLWWSFSPSPTGFRSIRRHTSAVKSGTAASSRHGEFSLINFFLFWCWGCCVFLPCALGV